MATWIALLRAINLGPRSRVAMPDLHARLEALGLEDVRTHLQTGNVVFATKRKDRERLRRDIEDAVAELVPERPQIFLLTPAELRRAARANPFEVGAEQQCVLVFLDAAPAAAAKRKLAEQEDDTYAIAVKGKVVYYTYPKAAGGRRRAIDFERILGVRGTARTHKVVARLVEMAGD
ncbi:MAG TPA: DUF1697 domain-containing protein [Solirubrobacteraceae bacterium]